MKFSVKHVNGKGYRVGILSGIKSNPEGKYETPLSLSVTQTGSIPHLTKDIYHTNFLKDSLLCIPAQHFAIHHDVLKAYKNGVASFAALPTHPVCIVVQDPSTKTRGGFNDQMSVSTWSTTGRVKLLPEKYIKLIAAMRPDWYETLNDSDTNSLASKKRIEKSLNNSFNFLEQCLKHHQSEEELNDVGVFAPLLGGLKPHDRTVWTEKIKDIYVDGYCLLGLHENGDTAQTLDAVQLRTCVEASLKNLPTDKVRQAQGAFSVKSVLEMVDCGVDIFDSSSAFIATESGKAFCFPNTLESINKFSSTLDIPDKKMDNLEELGKIRGDSLAKEIKDEERNKKIKIDCSPETNINLSSISNGIDSRHLEKIEHEINLKDKRFMNSIEPLLRGCECYTCITFTKAYLHHLLSSKEMLATVLLMIHNLHHWELFFKTIREAIKSEQFDKLKSVLLNTKM